MASVKYTYYILEDEFREQLAKGVHINEVGNTSLGRLFHEVTLTCSFNGHGKISIHSASIQ